MLLISALFGCLVCSAASLSLGALLLRWLVNRENEKRLQVGPVAMTASAFLLGQGALTSVWTLIGVAGWFTGPVVISSLVLSIACGGWAARPWLCAVGLLPAGDGLEGRAPMTAGRRVHLWLCDAWSDAWPWRLLLLATLLLVLFYGMAAWVFPIPSRADGASYYLPLAKCLVATGHLRPVPGYESFSQIPVFGELHFAAMMFFGVEQEARLIVTPTTLAGAALLVALGARCGLGTRAQWMLLAVAWTSTAFTERLTDGKTDLFGFAMGTAAYYWVAVYRSRDGLAALRLSGLFVSLAAVAKLTLAACVLPGVILFSAWTAACSEEGKGVFRRARSVLVVWFHLGFWTMLFVLANFVKNGVLYGEPFAPFFTLSASKGWIYQSAFHSPEVAKEVLLMYPLLLVYGHIRGQGGSISILLLALAALVAVLPRPRAWKQSPLLKTACMGLLGLASYLVAAHITSNAQVAPRYILPTLLLFALPIARATEYVIAREPRPRFLTALIWFSLFVALFSAHRDSGVRRWVGHLKSHLVEGRSRNSDLTLDALDELNRLAAPGDRLYMASPARVFLRSDLLQCINKGGEALQGDDSAARWAMLHARGFSWVLIDRPNLPKVVRLLGIRDDGSAKTPPWLELDCVAANSRCYLFRLKPAPDAPAPAVGTTEVRPGLWDVLAR